MTTRCRISHKNTNHKDGRTQIRPLLFVSVKTLQEQEPKPRKNVWDLSSGEDGFSVMKTNYSK
jgi:hypothetical protein